MNSEITINLSVGRHCIVKHVTLIAIFTILLNICAALYILGRNNNKPILFDIFSRKNIEANAETTSKDEDRQELYEKSNVDVKYILQWHEDGSYPFYVIGEDNSVFFKYNCPYTNCIMTDDPNYLSDVTRFDAVLFHGNEIDHEILKLPPKRSTKQKYVFAATESAHYYPIQNPIYDNFFNWTWTYRLDSEVYWGYITIYDLNGIVVGPKLEMHWPDMDPIGIEIQNNLVNKSKAAAWFVSNCNSKSHRELEVTKIQIELAKYGWSVDIYGKCGELKCPRSNSKSCYELIKKDYYFYFSFENSFAEDYVTEKLLTALNNYAVPVVFGAANYSRFVPPGAYLNARELGPEKLAKAMDEIIKNKTRYYDFFRWRNHFVYEETIGTIDGCNICTALNDQEKFNTYSLYENFRKWWNEYD
ncbi:alpha-(1,3)-fucosyltransferase C-like isoform X2 [Galleria mellonella]|uniref:Fucosyltransferase n=1 Tax=Galleria mellonella TaxID=7137 RepID=A0A6J1X2M4_GALME|nr:alpha-(1,3)-fucosyltransferase C-like isoform X2 [Galleria mellonella]